VAFQIDTSSPPDNQIVSQFPGTERTHRGQLKSIITEEHDEGTGHHALPAGNEANRDAMSAAVTGTAHFNEAGGIISQYDGAAWDEFGTLRTGDMKMAAYDPTSPPEGWLDCDGASYDGSQAAYAALYAKIGTAFNVGGEGANIFRVPDLQGKAPFGYYSGGDGDGDFATIGESADTKTHEHTISAPDDTDDTSASGTNLNVATDVHIHTTTAAGNVPPYVTIGFLIKL
jgi:microcystin-dependent protein